MEQCPRETNFLWERLFQLIKYKTMTREKAKELLPIIQAFAEGKAIESRCIKYDKSLWYDDEDPTFDNDLEYRIKPEQKYRPFANAEECWTEMLKHQPFGWVKSPRGELFCIDKVFDEGVVYKHSSCRFEEYLDSNYTFADGTPFGIKEE